MIRAIFFDAFGTVVKITRPMRPYRIAGAGLECMTEPLHIGHYTDDPAIHAALDDELSSIQAFPDTFETLERLRGYNLRLAVGSNLALPYGDVVRRIIGDRVEHYHMSYEVGLIKPDPMFFLTLCDAMSIHPGEALMVGDSRRDDMEGARAAGLRGFHLDRRAGTTLHCLIEIHERYFMKGV